MYKYKRGMVFGVFDGLHPGHEFFLRTASGKCDRIVVVVARDTTSNELKRHLPRQGIKTRIKKVKADFPEADVVMGDTDINTWKILDKHKPDIIFLGHDQQEIAKELEKKNLKYEFIDSHEPEKYKSSLLDDYPK